MEKPWLLSYVYVLASSGHRYHQRQTGNSRNGKTPVYSGERRRACGAQGHGAAVAVQARAEERKGEEGERGKQKNRENQNKKKRLKNEVYKINVLFRVELQPSLFDKDGFLESCVDLIFLLRDHTDLDVSGASTTASEMSVDSGALCLSVV